LLGGTAAALICSVFFGRDVVIAGTPQLGTTLNPAQGILIEAILTFFLVFVVHGTGVDAGGVSRVWRSVLRSHSIFFLTDRLQARR